MRGPRLLPMCGPVDQIMTSCSGCATGSRRSINWSISVKMAVLAPMPRAREATATRQNSGLRVRLRRANRRSNRNLAMPYQLNTPRGGKGLQKKGRNQWDRPGGLSYHENTLMDWNRRDFMLAPAALIATDLLGAEPAVPWQRKIRRLGQTNMTEHDPAVLDVEQWADYWASLKVDAVMVSVTGILAFYQTQVPYHRKGKYLGNRDFFGECCAAAKKRGIHAIARMSPDLNWEDAVQAHPEWFQRDAQGNAVHHTEDPRLFRTCMFTTYMTDYMPAIMKEINSLYDVDGLYTNAWPPLGSLPVCYCEQCK